LARGTIDRTGSRRMEKAVTLSNNKWQ